MTRTKAQTKEARGALCAASAAWQHASELACTSQCYTVVTSDSSDEQQPSVDSGAVKSVKNLGWSYDNAARTCSGAGPAPPQPLL